MNTSEAVIFLENAFTQIDANESKLKALSDTIVQAGREIKAIRAFRDEAVKERDELIEASKQLAIQLEEISKQYESDGKTT